MANITDYYFWKNSDWLGLFLVVFHNVLIHLKYGFVHARSGEGQQNHTQYCYVDMIGINLEVT